MQAVGARDIDEDRKRRGFLAFLAMVVFVALQLLAIQIFAAPESGASELEPPTQSTILEK